MATKTKSHPPQAYVLMDQISFKLKALSGLLRLISTASLEETPERLQLAALHHLGLLAEDILDGLQDWANGDEDDTEEAGA